MKFVAALGWDIDIEMRPSGDDRVRVHSTDTPRDDEKLFAWRLEENAS